MYHKDDSYKHDFFCVLFGCFLGGSLDVGFHHVGWFARDPTILRKVGHILLQLPYMDVRQPRRILIADDCFKLSLIPNEHTVGAVIRSVQKIIGRTFLPVLIYVDG